MADTVLRGAFPRANTLLAQVRAAHLERIKDARDRTVRNGSFGMASLPGSLVALGCWLVAHGCTDPASEAEQQMGWGPDTYRAYLARLDGRATEQEMQSARRTIFEGRRAIITAGSATPALREAA